MSYCKILLQIIILVSLVSCNLWSVKVEEVPVLSERINEVIVNQEELKLGELTNFEWDSVFVFPPYTSFNEVRSEVKCDWNELEGTNIDRDDMICLLLFKNKGILNRYLLHSRAKGDFSRIKITAFSKESAIFKVRAKKRSASNWYYLEVD